MMSICQPVGGGRNGQLPTPRRLAGESVELGFSESCLPQHRAQGASGDLLVVRDDHRTASGVLQLDVA